MRSKATYILLNFKLQLYCIPVASSSPPSLDTQAHYQDDGYECHETQSHVHQHVGCELVALGVRLPVLYELDLREASFPQFASVPESRHLGEWLCVFRAYAGECFPERCVTCVKLGLFPGGFGDVSVRIL